MTKHAKGGWNNTQTRRRKEGNHPQSMRVQQKRAPVMSERQPLCQRRSTKIEGRWLWWNQMEAPMPEPVCKSQRCGGYELMFVMLAFNWVLKVKCEVNPPTLASCRQKWWNVVKSETAPTSDSDQYILAWRSKDSVESEGSSQSEAQPGSGCNATPGAAQSGGRKRPGARAGTKQT